MLNQDCPLNTLEATMHETRMSKTFWKQHFMNQECPSIFWKQHVMNLEANALEATVHEPRVSQNTLEATRHELGSIKS